MTQKPGEGREKILMLIAPPRGRPLAVAVAAQIDGNGMPKRIAALYHRRNKWFPTAPLIADAVDEDNGFLARVTPLPIMNFQPVMHEEMFPVLQIHRCASCLAANNPHR